MRRRWKQFRCGRRRHDWRPLANQGGQEARSINRAMNAQVMKCRWCGKTGVLR